MSTLSEKVITNWLKAVPQELKRKTDRRLNKQHQIAMDVDILEDFAVESDETLFINLSNVTGGLDILNNQGRGTIVGDDRSMQQPGDS